MTAFAVNEEMLWSTLQNMVLNMFVFIYSLLYTYFVLTFKVTYYPGHVKKDESGCCKLCTKCTDEAGTKHKVGSVWDKNKCTTCTCKGDNASLP